MLFKVYQVLQCRQKCSSICCTFNQRKSRVYLALYQSQDDWMYETSIDQACDLQTYHLTSGSASVLQDSLTLSAYFQICQDKIHACIQHLFSKMFVVCGVIIGSQVWMSVVSKTTFLSISLQAQSEKKLHEKGAASTLVW